jgi:hypothetical protein
MDADRNDDRFQLNGQMRSTLQKQIVNAGHEPVTISNISSRPLSPADPCSQVL